MSASREKKTRQQAGAELTEKQLKAQREAAATKRKTVTYTVIGVVCAVLAAALLIWNSGFFQGRAKALTVGEQSYTAADVRYYFNQIYNQYYLQARYGMDIGLDINTDLDEQMYDAENQITWRDHIMEETIEAMKEVTALTAQAKEEGYTLSKEGEQSVQDNLHSLVSTSASNGFSSVGSYLKAAYGKTMTQGRMRTLLRNNMLAQEMEQNHRDALTYTDEEIDAYYTEHADELDHFTYDYFAVNAAAEAEDESAAHAAAQPTEDTASAARTEAEKTAWAIADVLRDGGDSDALAAEYEENDKVTSHANQEYEGSMLDTAIADWLTDAARQSGDVTVIEQEEDENFIVLRFVDRSRDETVSADIRHVLVAAEQAEGADEPTQEQYAAAKTKAEELLAGWKAGEATEESFAALAEAESADPGSAENGGLYEQVSPDSGFIEEFTEWAMDPARQPGDTGLVQNTQSSTKGWHIMYFVKHNDEAWKLDARSAKVSQDSHDWVEQLANALEVQKLDGLKNV